MATAGMIHVKMVHSGIGFDQTQKDTLRGLGLRRPNRIVALKDTPQIRGMIYKVRHLVQVIDAKDAAAKPSPWKGVIIVPGPKTEPKPAKKAAKAEKKPGKKKSKPAKKGK